MLCALSSIVHMGTKLNVMNIKFCICKCPIHWGWNLTIKITEWFVEYIRRNSFSNFICLIDHDCSAHLRNFVLRLFDLILFAFFPILLSFIIFVLIFAPSGFIEWLQRNSPALRIRHLFRFACSGVVPGRISVTAFSTSVFTLVLLCRWLVPNCLRGCQTRLKLDSCRSSSSIL